MCYLSIGNKLSHLIVIIAFGIFTHATVNAQVYVSDDFESGSLNKWYVYDDVASTTKTGITKNIGGNPTSVLHLQYDMPAGGPDHRAYGQYIATGPGGNVDHLFVSGRFYSEPTSEPTEARKLIYIKSAPWKDPKWDLMISLRGGVNGPICINLNSNAYPYSDLRAIEWSLACGKVNYGEWHFIEVELKLNTVNMKDGWARLWLDGNLEYERKGIAVRNDTKPFGWVEIGRQLDRDGDSLPRFENRYWDDITFSSTYVGVDAKPEPPGNVR